MRLSEWVSENKIAENILFIQFQQVDDKIECINVSVDSNFGLWEYQIDWE